jgi:hypothetical protein
MDISFLATHRDQLKQRSSCISSKLKEQPATQTA